MTPKPLEHEGYETPKEKTETVRADGTTVVKYYYPRAEYHLTFLMEENGETVASDDYRYGTFLTAPAVYRPGYEFRDGHRKYRRVCPQATRLIQQHGKLRMVFRTQ